MPATETPVDSREVPERLVEALRLDRVGPRAGHELEAEQLPGRERPSSFLIPTGWPPDRSADADEDDDLDTIPESAALAEESNEERKAARKAFVPSSIGLSFLVAGACDELPVTVCWGDYAPAEMEDAGGDRTPVWRWNPHEAALPVPLGGRVGQVVWDVPGSGGLRLHVAGLDGPRWGPIQLAYLLLILPGLANPSDAHRETVDLLFFPIGGGNTEAYLGLAAAAMVLRCLRHPGDDGLAGAGVSVIMRYTLRLLTLDRLAGAVGLVCVLEISRCEAGPRHGSWPCEIGFRAGKAAMPNILDRRADGRRDSARAWVVAFASLPWVGESGALPGGADRFDAGGSYGAAETGQRRRLTAPLSSPDLLIQDEHLIARVPGAMAGLYETPIEARPVPEVDGQVVKPKISALTATARRAQDPLQALFACPMTQQCPPSVRNRGNSILARTLPSSETPALRFVGIASQGRKREVPNGLARLGAGGPGAAGLAQGWRPPEPPESVPDGPSPLQQPVRAGRSAAHSPGVGPHHAHAPRGRALGRWVAPAVQRPCQPHRGAGADLAHVEPAVGRGAETARTLVRRPAQPRRLRAAAEQDLGRSRHSAPRPDAGAQAAQGASRVHRGDEFAWGVPRRARVWNDGRVNRPGGSGREGGSSARRTDEVRPVATEP